jgi:hypothetical protein
MPSAEVEPAISASDWPQTHALDRAAPGIGTHLNVITAFPYIHHDHISSFIVLHSPQLAILRAVSMIIPMQIAELINMSVEVFGFFTCTHKASSSKLPGRKPSLDNFVAVFISFADPNGRAV